MSSHNTSLIISLLQHHLLLLLILSPLFLPPPRVCDMLMVYIKAAPNMTLHVGLVIPLIKAVRLADFDARWKDLQNKLA